MSLPVFQAACVAVVLLTLAAMARTRPWHELLVEYALLAVAGWIGEQTCIAFYAFYHYAPGWAVRLGHVPLLVPLIWPLVILSAREVATALGVGGVRGGGGLGDVRGVGRRALVVGAIVAFDASLVEVVAVRAGLWSWAEPGYLGVPVIGILGWGFFAAGAELISSYLHIQTCRYMNIWMRACMAVLGPPIVAHGLILVSWWGLFRWTIRGDLGWAGLAGVLVVAAAALVGVIAARRRGDGIPLSVAAPRMIAAALFVALLVTEAPRAADLWLHAAAVAAPYLAATRFTAGRRSPAALPAARSPSRR